MNFQNLDIKISYDSIKDDLYDSFFIPVLSNSVECKRFGGNFSSKNFRALICFCYLIGQSHHEHEQTASLSSKPLHDVLRLPHRSVFYHSIV